MPAMHLAPSQSRMIEGLIVAAGCLVMVGCPSAANTASNGADIQTGDATSDSAESDAGDDPGDATAKKDGSQKPNFHVCDNAPLPENLGTEDWNELTTPATTALGDPYHSARDRITNPGRAVNLVGKFSYGSIQKDLDDEVVSLWIDDCSGSYRKIGEQKTNDEGRVFLPINPDTLPTPGRYATYFYVRGDGSSASGSLRVLPPGTELVVFDIDGTLTKGDRELANDIVSDLFNPLLSGDYVPEARADAAAATDVYRTHHGYQLAYLTARPYWLGHRTREWLATRKMALGALRLSPSTEQSLPTNGSVGEFKAGYIRRLTETLGLEVRRAYGNSTTDIYAYRQNNIPASEIFVPGKHGGEQGTVDLGEDYSGHVSDVRTNYRPADQPWRQ